MNVVYKITFPNQKAYIGKTKKGIEHRVKQHVSNAINNRGKSPLVENAIRKYGSQNITYEVLGIKDSEDELSSLEIELIAKHNTLSPNGYNLTSGGDGNSTKHTDEFKLQKSLSMRKNCKNMHLEMYVKYQKTKKGSEGFIVIKPGFKSAQFCTPDKTLDEKLELANEYARSLSRGEIIEVNRYKHKDLGYNIPKGISYLGACDGFRVTLPGKSNKYFKSSKLTREEKYNLALQYYNECLGVQRPNESGDDNPQVMA